MAKRKKRATYIVLSRFEAAQVAASIVGLLRHVQGQKGAAQWISAGNEALGVIWNAPPLPPIGVEPK